MCVNDVREVKVAGGVFEFVCNAEIEVSDPHGELLLDAFVLQKGTHHKTWKYIFYYILLHAFQFI